MMEKNKQTPYPNTDQQQSSRFLNRFFQHNWPTPVSRQWSKREDKFVDLAKRVQEEGSVKLAV